MQKESNLQPCIDTEKKKEETDARNGRWRTYIT